MVQNGEEKNCKTYMHWLDAYVSCIYIQSRYLKNSNVFFFIVNLGYIKKLDCKMNFCEM